MKRSDQQRVSKLIEEFYRAPDNTFKQFKERLLKISNIYARQNLHRNLVHQFYNIFKKVTQKKEIFAVACRRLLQFLDLILQNQTRNNDGNGFGIAVSEIIVECYTYIFPLLFEYRFHDLILDFKVYRMLWAKIITDSSFDTLRNQISKKHRNFDLNKGFTAQNVENIKKKFISKGCSEQQIERYMGITQIIDRGSVSMERRPERASSESDESDKLRKRFKQDPMSQQYPPRPFGNNQYPQDSRAINGYPPYPNTNINPSLHYPNPNSNPYPPPFNPTPTFKDNNYQMINNIPNPKYPPPTNTNMYPSYPVNNYPNNPVPSHTNAFHHPLAKPIQPGPYYSQPKNNYGGPYDSTYSNNYNNNISNFNNYPNNINYNSSNYPQQIPKPNNNSADYLSNMAPQLASIKQRGQSPSPQPQYNPRQRRQSPSPQPQYPTNPRDLKRQSPQFIQKMPMNTNNYLLSQFLGPNGISKEDFRSQSPLNSLEKPQRDKYRMILMKLSKGLYECKQCGVKFLTKDNLAQHKSQHFAEAQKKFLSKQAESMGSALGIQKIRTKAKNNFDLMCSPSEWTNGFRKKQEALDYQVIFPQFMFLLKGFQIHKGNPLYFIAAYVMNKWIQYGVNSCKSGLWIRPQRSMNLKKDQAQDILTVTKDLRLMNLPIRQLFQAGDQYYNSMTSHSLYLAIIIPPFCCISAFFLCLYVILNIDQLYSLLMSEVQKILLPKIKKLQLGCKIILDPADFRKGLPKTKMPELHEKGLIISLESKKSGIAKMTGEGSLKLNIVYSAQVLCVVGRYAEVKVVDDLGDMWIGMLLGVTVKGRGGEGDIRGCRIIKVEGNAFVAQYIAPAGNQLWHKLLKKVENILENQN